MKIFGSIMGILGFILLSGIGFVYYTEGASAFSMQSVAIQESQEISGKNVTELKLTTLSTDVEVLPHKKENFIIELNGEVSEKMKDAYELTVEEDNGVLTIDLDRKYKTSFSIFAINKGTKLTVLVPEKKYDEIVIESKSGDVKVEELHADLMVFNATSGDIVVEDLASTDLSIHTTSGDTFAKGLSTDTLTMKAISGDIIADQLDADSKIKLNAKSGDITLSTDVPAYTLDFKGTSGDGTVKVSEFLYKEKEEDRIFGSFGNVGEDDGGLMIEVRTTSGDFTLE